MRIIKCDAYDRELIAIAKEISHYLQKAGARQADSDDIAQDVLVKLLEADVILPRAKIRAWLYRSAIRSYIDKYRRDKRYHEILQRDFFRPEEELVYDREDYAFVHEAVAELKIKSALLIDCYYFQGFSIEECSQLLGLTKGQVKTRLYRARKDLKKILEKKGYHHEDL